MPEVVRRGFSSYCSYCGSTRQSRFTDIRRLPEVTGGHRRLLQVVLIVHAVKV